MPSAGGKQPPKRQQMAVKRTNGICKACEYVRGSTYTMKNTILFVSFSDVRERKFLFVSFSELRERKSKR